MTPEKDHSSTKFEGMTASEIYHCTNLAEELTIIMRSKLWGTSQVQSICCIILATQSSPDKNSQNFYFKSVIS